MNIYDVIDKDTFVYPVDLEKEIQLILYPDGQFYLGESHFIPFADLLALAKESLEASEEGKYGKKQRMSFLYCLLNTLYSRSW